MSPSFPEDCVRIRERTTSPIPAAASPYCAPGSGPVRALHPPEPAGIFSAAEEANVVTRVRHRRRP